MAFALCIGLTLFAYGSSLQAGIMFDAALDLPRATERTWLEVLSGAGPSPYFRPVTLLLWKACYELLGRNDFTVLHGLSLASHILCGWLVYQLGRRLLSWQAGLAAAALFVWFPLSYQVVGFVDSLFHSLAALWSLGAAVLYWDARAVGSRSRMAAALGCGALALLTHEGTAALLTPAIMALELLRRRRIGKIGSPWWPAAFAAETLTYVAIWLVVPRWPSTPTLDVPSLELNATYFFQMIGYPLTMLLGHLPHAGQEVAEVLAVAAVSLGGLLALAAVRKQLAVATFGLVWFGAALALPCLLLPWPNYVIDAPRLLYAGSAGIALIWAAALVPGQLSGTTILGGVGLAAVLAESYAFIGIRAHLLDQGAALVREVVATAVQPGSQAGRTYVNLPAFLGPKEPDFLLGHSGVTMLPDYFGLDLEIAAVAGARLPVDSLAYDDLARPWDEAYGLQGQHVGRPEAIASVSKGGGVFVTRFEPGRLGLEHAGRVEQRNGMSGAPLARFGDWTALEQAAATTEGDILAIHLAWQALAQAPGDFTVFVHVVGESPQPLLQSDGYPIAGLLPPQAWPPGSVVYDERRLALPPPARGRPLRVLVGLYDRASPVTRAFAVNGSGVRLADDAVLVIVQEVRP